MAEFRNRNEAIVENTKEAFETLQIENTNLKTELEQCREDLKWAKQEKEFEVNRERTNTSTSHRLNEELERKIDELRNPSATNSLNEEMFVIEKTKLEKQVSEKSDEIEKIDFDLKSAREEITELKKDNSKGEVIDLEFKLGKSQEENKQLREESKAMFLENEEMRKDSREFRRLSEPGAKPPKISAKRNYSQPSPILEEFSMGLQESEETGEKEKTFFDPQGELLASKTRIDELNSQQDTHNVEKIAELETELGKSQLELEKVRNEYQELITINTDLQQKLNMSTEVNEESKRIQIELQEEKRELERECIRLDNELRENENRFTESLQPASLPEKDEELVQSYRNAPPPRYQTPEQNRPNKIEFFNPGPIDFPTRPQLFENPRTIQDTFRIPTHDPLTPFTQSKPLEEPCVSATSIKEEDWKKTLFSGRVKVLIYWKKELQTMESEITYFDNRDENVRLAWDGNKEFYKGIVEFSTGEHSGGLVFPSSGNVSEVQSFIVEPKEDTAMEWIRLKLVSTISADNIA